MIMEENPREWHKLVSKTLWAYWTSKRISTGITPYAMTYGHATILHIEMVVQSYRVTHQHKLIANNYTKAIMIKIKQLDEVKLSAFDRLVIQKKWVSRAYNKHVKPKVSAEGQLMWKIALPLGVKDRKYKKWSIK